MRLPCHGSDPAWRWLSRPAEGDNASRAVDQNPGGIGTYAGMGSCQPAAEVVVDLVRLL